MIVIRDPGQIDTLADTELRQLLHTYVEQYRQYPDYPLQDLVHFIVVQEGDSIDSIDAALGYPILGNRFTGETPCDPGFAPDFEISQEHQGWFELVYVRGDDGYGCQVFVPKSHEIDPQLLAFCAAYVSPGKC
jgi:hypothetical protein